MYETTVIKWYKVIEKHMKHANGLLECFKWFGEADDLDRLIDDCESILVNARAAKKDIEHMDSK
jgi:hypothetical protein